MDISIEIRRKKISRFIFQGHPLGNFCQNLYQWTHEFLTTKFFISFLANILVIVYIYIYMKKIKVHFNNFSRTFSMLDPLPVRPIDKIEKTLIMPARSNCNCKNLQKLGKSLQKHCFLRFGQA